MITWRKTQVMHSVIAHQPLIDVRPCPHTLISPFWVTPPVYILGISFYSVESFWLVCITCPSYASSQLFVYFLTGRAWDTKSLT